MNVPEQIIAEIRSRGIAPRPRWHFLLKRSMILVLAACSSALGGIAVAVIIFIFIDYDAATRAYLNHSIFEDLLHTIPYLWLGTLLLLIVLTQYAVRHLRYGYRYSSLLITSTVVACSVLLGVAMSALEVGERVQDFLATSLPHYSELVSTSKTTWSHPEKGLLAGTIVARATADEISLTDFNNKQWVVDISRLDAADDPIIHPGSIVRLIGSEEDATSFRAIQAFPWKK